MRRWSILAAALALTALVARPAGAATLPVHGTLTVVLGAFGGPEITGTGLGTSNGAFALATIPAGALSLAQTASIPIDPPVLNLDKITVGPAQNFAGSFGPNGAMGNDGVANLFFSDGSMAGSVPLAYIGGGGTGVINLAGIPVTVLGATWTNLGVTAGDPTRTTRIMKIAAGIAVTVTATAYDRRTPGGLGTVQLVAPVVARIFGGALGELPVVGVLTLQYVPEPGTLVLLGAGVAGLAAVGHRRSRR